MPPSTAHTAAVILAAGKGTRMKSDLPKVVHPVGGRAMVCAVVNACRAVGCEPIVAVVGYQQDKVRAALAGSGVAFAVQEPQLGTGHAVQCAESVIRDATVRERNERPPSVSEGIRAPSASARSNAPVAGAPGSDVIVLCGDGPLIRPATLWTLLERHRATGASATLATAIIDDPTGYGRIVRDASGAFERIVEHKDATAAERGIREVNPSYYCFRQHDLFSALRDVKRNETSGEYYLTDVLSLLLARGKRVEVVPAVPPEDVLSINTPDDLALVDSIYRARGEPRRAIA
jgi:bifunctional N-acetylglucosamine-1-phosphate-uridyltransferase/glucosamine-1-phosphate-acetyltransferase GlmU-like protein